MEIALRQMFITKYHIVLGAWEAIQIDGNISRLIKKYNDSSSYFFS